jgi:hypothetical protein
MISFGAAENIPRKPRTYGQYVLLHETPTLKNIRVQPKVGPTTTRGRHLQNFRGRYVLAFEKAYLKKKSDAGMSSYHKPAAL